MKEEINMKDKIVKLSNGVKVINTSPHPFTFEDGTVVPPCGRTLNAEFKEGVFGSDAMSITQLGVKLLSSTLEPRAEDVSFVAKLIQEEYAASTVVEANLLFLGSKIAAEAFGYPVVMAKPTAETAGRGTPPADKVMVIDQFTAWSSSINYYDLAWADW